MSQASGSRREGTVSLCAKGVLIGIANIIPGVSGGTFALILGIFDRMIDALHRIGLSTVGASLGLITGGFGGDARSRFAAEWRRCDMGFLLKVAIGALAAIVACSRLIEWLLIHEPGATLSFFLGLIAPSLAVPWGMMKRRGLPQLFWILPGAALTVGLALAFKGGATASSYGFGVELVVAFCSGAIAVSAMILPGISGSFVMLVLGQYAKILAHVNALASVAGIKALLRFEAPAMKALAWLAAMGAGIVAGLLAFSRLLNYLLRSWRSATMAFLIGLVLGSFWVLWPFKYLDALLPNATSDMPSGVFLVGRKPGQD